MSRTKHHKTQKTQHCGEDLWKASGDFRGCRPYNAYNKKLARKKDRKRLNKLQSEDVT